MKKIFFLSLFWLLLFFNAHAQPPKNYLRYIDTVNTILESHPRLGPIGALKFTPGKGFGNVQLKPYHIAFNFNSKDIKNFFWLCMEEFDKVGMLDSLLVDTSSINCSGLKTRLYLPQKLPFKLQSAILKAMDKQVTAVDEIVLTDKQRMGQNIREVLIGGGDLGSYYEGEYYLRKFSKIRAVAKAQNQAELIQLFKDFDDKKPSY